jgi:hypothetical protein
MFYLSSDNRSNYYVTHIICWKPTCLSQKYQDCIAICHKFDALPNLATITSNTKLYIQQTHNLRLLYFDYIIFSNYSFVQCITIFLKFN